MENNIDIRTGYHHLLHDIISWCKVSPIHTKYHNMIQRTNTVTVPVLTIAVTTCS